jgi:hypothetical protein
MSVSVTVQKTTMFAIVSGIRVPASSVGLGSTSIWECPIAEYDDHQNQYADSGIVMLGQSASKQAGQQRNTPMTGNPNEAPKLIIRKAELAEKSIFLGCEYRRVWACMSSET